MPDHEPTDSTLTPVIVMPDADDSIATKHTSSIPSYLSEQMSVGRMVEVLEALHFNKREQAQLVIDPGIQAFLLAATKAAAADHLDAKVRHAWRAIRPPR